MRRACRAEVGTYDGVGIWEWEWQVELIYVHKYDFLLNLSTCRLLARSGFDDAGGANVSSIQSSYP